MDRIDETQTQTKELKEKLVSVNRVSKTVKGGRMFKFAALMVVGDGEGTIGFGIGKAGEVPDAIRKGIEEAKKNLTKISLRGSTIPHETIGIFGAGKVLMKPASPGTGVIAGGPVRAVVEAAGIKDIRTKALRSNNPCNVVRATLQGLKSLRTAEEVASIREKQEKDILPERTRKPLLHQEEIKINVATDVQESKEKQVKDDKVEKKQESKEKQAKDNKVEKVQENKEAKTETKKEKKEPESKND